jgi:hypothetical protein
MAKSFPKHILCASSIMAPPAAVEVATHPQAYHNGPTKTVPKTHNSNTLDKPLKYSGSLDQYGSFDTTPVIGREFPTLQISDILNDDNKIRDLAVLGTIIPI